MVRRCQCDRSSAIVMNAREMASQSSKRTGNIRWARETKIHIIIIIIFSATTERIRRHFEYILAEASPE